MTDKPKQVALNTIVPALCAALLFAQQLALQLLPNIELVSLLIIVFTLVFQRRVFYIIYVFALLEGVYYGFNLWWWIPYLYIWTILALVTWLLSSYRSVLLWAFVSGIFGLCFGALCSLPYLLTGGWILALGYWVSGIPFDLIHCVSNFIICLVLWRPIMRIVSRFSGGAYLK